MTLRTRLLLTSVGLTLLTVCGGMANGLNFARQSGRNLLDQIVAKSGANVYGEMFRIIQIVDDRNELNCRLYQTNTIDLAPSKDLIRFWLDAMEIHEELTWLSFIAADGTSLGVGRRLDGRLYVQEVSRESGTNKMVLHDYWPEDYPRLPKASATERDTPDFREYLWYRDAVAQKKQVWSRTHLFVGEQGRPEIPGVTCAAPVYTTDGLLRGVATADFDLFRLSHYLKDLNVSPNGYAFVIELRPDGTHPVIAHPKPELLLEDVPGDDGTLRRQLVPAARINDDRVRQFVACLPAHLEKQRTGFSPVSFELDDASFVGGYQYVKGESTPEWLICVVLPEEDVMGAAWQKLRILIFVASLLVLFVGFISILLARQVARPLEALIPETERIGNLQLESRPVLRSRVVEVRQLSEALEEMKISLRSFQKYVPTELVRTLMKSKQEAGLTGEQRLITISFSDIANFTEIAEQLPAQELVHHLREYFELLSQRVVETGGTVDKYIGDAIMSFWGAPLPSQDHALSACIAAIRGRAALREAAPIWEAAGKPTFRTRFGINSGLVVVGNIGSNARLNYTVIGDAVNLASRLEGLNKHYATEILISDATYKLVEPAVIARPIDWVTVKGKSEAVLIYELLALRADFDETPEWVGVYTEALAAYRNQDWDRALDRFAAVCRLHPDDGPARTMLDRCFVYRSTPPGPVWDGVHRMAAK